MIRLIYTLILIFGVIFIYAQETDTTKVFKLGEVSIVAEKPANVVNQLETIKRNQQDVSQAITQMPSVWFVNYGSRNESVAYIRGFDSRAVPLFIDGVPVYIPYDGLIDLGRFKTFGYSKIDVSKGLSPMAFGPNTMGGAINLVTTRPTKNIEAQVVGGFSSGNGYQYGVSVGSKMKKFYMVADYIHSQQDFFPLSADFETIKNEDGEQRNNSYSSDDNLHFKLGFTPNASDEYAISASHQQGEKGNPPYAGIDPLNKPRFWQWPVWNKSSIYFISNTKLDKNFKLKSRIFYDNFKNTLKAFDDSTYSTQNKSSSFTSFYDDFGIGGNLLLEFTGIKNNMATLSVHFKSDNHSEHNEGEGARKMADNTFSMGIDDRYLVNNKLSIISGASFNSRQGILAEEYFSSADSIASMETGENTALNGQVGAFYSVSKKMTIKASIAHKTRFANMKERYSYKMGRALPNPDLRAEQATHYELNSIYQLNKKIQFRPAFYYIYIQDVIQTVDEVEPGKSQMQNTGVAEFQGFDLEMKYDISKMFELYANYSYINRKNITNSSLLFTDIPEHKIYGQLTIKPVKNLEISANANYLSKRYSTSYGIVAGEFTVYNLVASYNFKGFMLGLGVNNILDENYAYSEGFAAPGRNFFANMTYNFGRK